MHEDEVVSNLNREAEERIFDYVRNPQSHTVVLTLILFSYKKNINL